MCYPIPHRIFLTNIFIVYGSLALGV